MKLIKLLTMTSVMLFLASCNTAKNGVDLSGVESNPGPENTPDTVVAEEPFQGEGGPNNDNVVNSPEETQIIGSENLTDYTRKELRQICREAFKKCKETNSRKECRRERRACRKEYGVTFWDDIKNIFRKDNEKVQFVLARDGNGEFIQVRVQIDAPADLDDFQFNYPNVASNISIGSEGSKLNIDLSVYASDFGNNIFGHQMQTSQGRSFPKFIDGQRYTSLRGDYLFNGHQFYIDEQTNIFGIFIVSRLVGHGMDWLNDIKYKLGKFGGLIPHINSIPVGLKAKGHIVGRFYTLSPDNEGGNPGILVLFDYKKLSSVLK